MPATQGIKGFTLLEVLLAMTLLSIMVVLLFSSLRIAAESWNKGEKKIAEVNEKAVVYQFFKQHFSTIKPLWNEFPDQESEFSFQASATQMQFVSVLPESAERKGLQLFQLKYIERQSGTLKVNIQPFYSSVDDQPWEADEVVLLEQIEDFELSYFGREDFSAVGEWTQSWQQKQSLPLLIKVKISLLDESDWPDMVFATRLASSDPDNTQGSGLDMILDSK